MTYSIRQCRRLGQVAEAIADEGHHATLERGPGYLAGILEGEQGQVVGAVVERDIDLLAGARHEQMLPTRGRAARLPGSAGDGRSSRGTGKSEYEPGRRCDA